MNAAEATRLALAIAAEFDGAFASCGPDDEPKSRVKVHEVCVRFFEARAVERLLEALGVLVTHVVSADEGGASGDEARKAITASLSLFWNASARPDPKCHMIECGVVEAVIGLNASIRGLGDRRFLFDVEEASLGIVPNLCQARFAHGHRNIHLDMLAGSRAVDFLLGHVLAAEHKWDAGFRSTRREDLRSWFMGLHAIANLSLSCTAHEALFSHFDVFFERNDIDRCVELFRHWNSFASFTSLLESRHAPVARWALRCLSTFARSDKNAMPRIFRALAIMTSCDSLRRWSTVPETAVYASELLQLIGLGSPNPLLQPDVPPPPPQLGAPAIDRAAMRAFSDILLVVVDENGVECAQIAAHKVVLASRSEFFAAKFASGMRDAAESRCVIDAVEPSAFEAAIEWVYAGRWPPTIDVQLAVDLVGVLVRFGIGQGTGALQQLEFLLVNQIDSREQADVLLDLCETFGVLPTLHAQLKLFLERSARADDHDDE